MQDSSLFERSKQFITFVQDWLSKRVTMDFAELTKTPEKVAILSTDMINGFCKTGALASPRVAALIEPITSLFRSAWSAGVRHILLSQDTHAPEALEFKAYPAHCVRGTYEAETVGEIKALSFFDQVEIFEKNTISSDLNTLLGAWIEDHPEVDIWIIVGDCTDLCIYQAAMHLRLLSNVTNIPHRVIVPADCVDTYDLSVSTAEKIGVLPHDGNLLHHLALYHLALNGIEVIKSFRFPEQPCASHN